MMDDDDLDRPRKLFGPLYWVLMAAAVLCIAGGAGVGFGALHLFAHHAARR